MSEATDIALNKDVTDVIIQQMRNFNVTRSLLQSEITGLYGSELLQDMAQMIRYYSVYEKGARFHVESTKDYVGADLRYKLVRRLINKEARFLFSNPPDIVIKPRDEKDADDKENTSQMQAFINEILDENGFDNKLVKGARDCFIAKRVALVANFNDEGITVNFIPSLEFVFETDPNNVDKLVKFVQIYNLNVSDDVGRQRIYKKKYWIENGLCHYSEATYDGAGTVVDMIAENKPTKFSYIPAWVITNDGLSGDPFGVSEIEELHDYESWYSKLSCKDMDSIRKGADQIKYAIDMSPESTKDLSVNAGAFWDLSTDQNQAEGTKGSVGVLENNMGYATALDMTLKRLKTTMHEAVDVPETSAADLQGIVTSGKTLKAIYWGLITRCNEKMLVWRPAIQKMVRCLIDGAELYPEIRAKYTEDKLEVKKGFVVMVENNYPLPEDETEEKASDAIDITNKTMSRKAHMMKWQGLTEDEADDEIDQLILEKKLLEDEAFGSGGDFGTTGGTVDGTEAI